MATAQIHTEGQLLGDLDRALNALARTTGLEGHVVALDPRTGKNRRADAMIDINAGGKKHRYLVEMKGNIDRLAMLGQVKTQLDQFDKPGLLFAPYITPAIANECRKLNIPFLDTAGNAYLKAPGLHIFITGERPPERKAMGARGGGTPAALRVVFALLCNRKLLNAPYRDIVDAAGVALGAIGWVFFDLKERGYITGGKKKQARRLVEPVRLFEEWVINYPIKLKPKLNARRFKADDVDWWRNTPLHDLGAFWGGEVAADRLTHYLKPATCTIYIKPEIAQKVLPRLVADHRLRADPNGNVEILNAFWNLPDDPAHPDIVPPILAYADLVATLDPRNLETAKLLREQFIDHAPRQT
jgi:hypothetical protein